MKTPSNWQAKLRIIGAIASKDIWDAIKNKMTLSIMLGVTVLMLSSMALPLLAGLQDTPAAVIYDPGRSALIRALGAREDFRLGFADSQEEMEAIVGGRGELLLGLVIPEGFKAGSGTGGSIDVAGYLPHWADPEEAADLVAFFEDTLGTLSWQTVHIDVTGHTAYPTLDDLGYAGMVSSTLSIAVLTIGLALVPHLLLEEKETHTFDALLISPASYPQIVMGKALTGLFYCLCAGAVVMVLNARWIVHGWLLLVALLLGAGFAVTLGLLLGSLFKDTSSVNLWMGLIVMGLQLPVFIAAYENETWPRLLRRVMSWLPSVALNKLVVAAMLGSLAGVDLVTPLILLAGSVIVLFGLAVWRVRRMTL